jgi:hypothetical protein
MAALAVSNVSGSRLSFERKAGRGEWFGVNLPRISHRQFPI